jgi:hypothetical protein
MKIVCENIDKGDHKLVKMLYIGERYCEKMVLFLFVLYQL